MKRLITPLLFLIVFSSCHKEKQPSIIGSWRQSAVYMKNPSGEFYWETNLRFPLQIVLTSDGKYSTFDDIPEANGDYQYDYLKRQLSLMNNSSGNISRYTISQLGEDDMIMDIESSDALSVKEKYSRQ